MGEMGCGRNSPEHFAWQNFYPSYRMVDAAQGSEKPSSKDQSRDANHCLRSATAALVDVSRCALRARRAQTDPSQQGSNRLAAVQRVDEPAAFFGQCASHSGLA